MFVLYLAQRMRVYGLSHQLIRMLALVDVTLGLGVVLMVAVGQYLGHDAAFKSEVFCPLFGFIANYFSGLSALLIGLLSFERYCLICHHFSLKTQIGWYVVVVFGAVFLVGAAGSSATNSFSPDPTFSYCWPSGTGWATVANSCLTLTFIASLVVLTFCYIAIFVSCYRWNRPSNRMQLTIKAEAARVSRRAALQAIFFIVMYHLCFLPKFISTMWQMLGNPQTHPFVLYMLGPVGISLSTAINPLMVIFLHSSFREEAAVVLGMDNDQD
ncbi:hypothetical protein DSO57_1017848 [Entomophthora muscae]|uniref:Uncharacterized protein n=1 Tax=Entomophthora muscae TaxID=34485 RepID=A0ACC2U2L2_9FUNG|nr:hypothetical protein DSO57_1017848 [Entomophthora muscae]